MSEKVGSIYYDVTLDTSQLIDGTRKVNRELDGVATRLTATAAAAAVLAAALASIKAAKLADEFRLLGARVEVAAGNIDAGAAAMAQLVEISRRTQSSLAGNIEVFTRLNQSILQMGGTQRDTLQLTELLAKAIKVSGANAVEAKAAMLQFGQALGSGKLGGDELRSLLENAPYLMRQLADGIGVPIGSLKKLGEEGKLTADVVTNALMKASSKIDADFKKFPQTIESAMVVAQDSAALAALKFDEFSGKSAALTGVIKGMGEVLDQLAGQLGAANDEAGNMGRNDAVASWAKSTKVALSYVADAADLVWQTLSVLGRNVVFVFKGIQAEIGGIAAQAAAVASGDFKAAAAIGDAMKADAEQRRKELDAADARTLGDAKLAGEKMRDAWEQGAGGGRGYVNPDAATSKPKSQVDQDAVNKLKAKAEAAQSYYQGLVAANKSAVEKVDAEEQKALADNARRMAMDKDNVATYAKAKIEIHAKFARERALLEEQATRQIAELNIATTVNEAAQIEAIRLESFRRADAEAKLGVITAAQAEREKVQATYNARKSYDDLAERNARARADFEYEVTKSQEQRIILVRDESIRQAREGYEQGRLTFEEAEAAKTRALQTAIEQQKALERSRADTQINTLQYKANTGGAQAQEDLIRAQADAALKAVEEARLKDLEANQIYADQKVAIEEDMNRRVADLRANANMAALNSTSDIFGSMAAILKSSGREQTGIYKVMFAAQKAFSIASSIVAIQLGIARASELPWPANLGAMASVAAATASIISTISGTQYGGGRQYGGPVSAGSLYRVNETGRPEMFTAANGNQYMMPTKSGSVTPADKVGAGGQAPTVIIQNLGAPVAVQSQSYDSQSNTVTMAIAEVANQISNNSGPVWSAMRGATNVQGRL